MPVGQGRQRPLIRGTVFPPMKRTTMEIIPLKDVPRGSIGTRPFPWPLCRPMLGVFTKCMEMSGSGVWTGTENIPVIPSRTPMGRTEERSMSIAAAVGTTVQCTAALPFASGARPILGSTSSGFASSGSFAIC